MQAGARVVVAGGIRSPVLRFPEVCLRLNSAVALFRCYLLLTSVPQLLQCQVQTVARALISCCGLSAELCRGKPAAAETGAGGGTGRKNRLPARASGGHAPRTSTPNRGIHLFPKLGIFPKWEKCSVTSARVGYHRYSIFLGITN